MQWTSNHERAQKTKGLARWSPATISILNADPCMRGPFAACTHNIWNGVQVHVGSSSLYQELKVENTSPNAFDFTAALHTYFGVTSIQQVSVLDIQLRQHLALCLCTFSTRDLLAHLAEQHRRRPHVAMAVQLMVKFAIYSLCLHSLGSRC